MQVIGDGARREVGVFAVEQRRTRFADGATFHASYVAGAVLEVPRNPRALVFSIRPVTDDLQLVRSAIAGDRLALAAIVRETQEHVWRYCAYLGRGSDVDDLVQDTYLRALRSLARYEGRASLRTWMLSIARRVCADAVRTARRRRRLDALFAREHAVADPGDRVAYALLIDGLMPERREAFVLTQIVGLSYADAADVCRVPVGTIRSRVARARNELHNELAEGTA
jgi:RNA polymerase sigma-70 factor, ECF subfamily